MVFNMIYRRRQLNMYVSVHQENNRVVFFNDELLLKAPKQATDISFAYAIISALPPWMFEPKWSFTPSKQKAKKQDKRRERASFILTSRHFGHGMKLCSIAISGLETVGITLHAVLALLKS